MPPCPTFTNPPYGLDRDAKTFSRNPKNTAGITNLANLIFGQTCSVMLYSQRPRAMKQLVCLVFGRSLPCKIVCPAVKRIAVKMSSVMAFRARPMKCLAHLYVHTNLLPATRLVSCESWIALFVQKGLKWASGLSQHHPFVIDHVLRMPWDRNKAHDSGLPSQIFLTLDLPRCARRPMRS